MMTDHASPIFGDLLGKIQMMEVWEPKLLMQYYPTDFPLLPSVLHPQIPAPTVPPTVPTGTLVVRKGLSKVKNPNYNPVYQRYQTSSTIRRAGANTDSETSPSQRMTKGLKIALGTISRGIVLQTAAALTIIKNRVLRKKHVS